MIDCLRARHPIVLALCLLSGACGREPAAGPVRAPCPLRFASDEAWLGTVYSGEQRSAVFPFYNEAPQALKLLSMETSCGCAAGSLYVGGCVVAAGEELPGGANGWVEIQFAKEVEKASTQTEHARLSFAGASGSSWAVRLQIHARVEPYFRIWPASWLSLPELLLPWQPSGESLATTEFRVEAAAPFAVESWDQLPEGFEIQELPGAEPEAAARAFQLSIRDDCAAGAYRFPARGRASNGLPLLVGVAVSIHPRVELLPPQPVRFTSAAASATLTLLSRDPELAIAGVTARAESGAAFTARVERAPAASAYLIEVALRPGLASGLHRDSLQIRADTNAGALQWTKPLAALLSP